MDQRNGTMEQNQSKVNSNKRSADRPGLAEHFRNLFFTWLAISAICVSLFGMLYDRPILATLLLVLPMTASVVVVLGIIFYNKWTKLATLSLIACVFIAYLLGYMVDTAQFIKGFLVWAQKDMFFIKMAYSPQYTPVAQILITVSIAGLLYFLLFGLRLPGVTCGVGIVGLGVFYYYTCIVSYGNYSTLWPLYCTIAFLASQVYFLAARYKRRGHRQGNALPVIAVTVVVTLLCTPMLNQLQRNMQVQNALYEWVNSYADGGTVAELFEKFFLPRSGFVSSRSKTLGGPIGLDRSERFTLQSTEPILLRGAIYDTYNGSTWNASDSERFILEEKQYSPDMSENMERYNYVFLNSREYIHDIKQFGDLIRSYSISDSVEWTSTVYSHTNVLRAGFDTDRALLCTDDGLLSTNNILTSSMKYTVQYISRIYNAEAMQKYYIMDALSEENMKQYLDTAMVTPKVRELAMQICSGSAAQFNSTLQYNMADKICRYLQDNYTYSLTPKHPEQDADFVEDFLFMQKEGYCVYFATAMTILARCAGLPARYVEGYRVDATGTTRVLSSNAHAWCEVFIHQVGWVPFDAVAPSDFNDTVLGTQQNNPTPIVTPEITVSPGLTPNDIEKNTPPVSSTPTSGATTPGVTLAVSGQNTYTSAPNDTESPDHPKGITAETWLIIALVGVVMLGALVVFWLIWFLRKKYNDKIAAWRQSMPVDDVLFLHDTLCVLGNKLHIAFEAEPTVVERLDALYNYFASHQKPDAAQKVSAKTFTAAAQAISRAAYSGIGPDEFERGCILEVLELLQSASGSRNINKAALFISISNRQRRKSPKAE